MRLCHIVRDLVARLELDLLKDDSLTVHNPKTFFPHYGYVLKGCRWSSRIKSPGQFVDVVNKEKMMRAKSVVSELP